jgi:two-component system chemotaxis response regulator CheB
VGHAWSSESLLARQAVELEGALWMALRSLEEKAALSADLAGRAERSGHARTAVRFHDNTQEAVRAAELVRQLITQIGDTVAAPRESDDVVEDRQNGRG